VVLLHWLALPPGTPLIPNTARHGKAEDSPTFSGALQGSPMRGLSLWENNQTSLEDQSKAQPDLSSGHNESRALRIRQSD
jgi:hypothetical protein